jgi:hypothetical protein
MTVVRWLARLAALGLLVAGTVVTAVRFGWLMALSAAGGTLLLVDNLAERVWPQGRASADGKSVAVQLASALNMTGDLTATVIRASGLAPGAGHTGSSANLGGASGLSAHGAARSGGSAILGFHSDAMTRLATGDYPAVDRSLSHH